MQQQHRYIWIDLETTGIKPASDLILEFAIVLVADWHDGDMSITQEFTSPLRFRDSDRAEVVISPYVERMHRESGLFGDCSWSTATEEDLDTLLCELTAGAPERSIMLAGNSVSFDLGFLLAYCPKFAPRLCHRVLDVSTLLSAAESWGTPIPRVASPAHRALADIRQSVAYAKAFREQAGWL